MVNKSDYQYMKYQAVRATGSLDIIDELIDAELEAKRDGEEVNYGDKISELKRVVNPPKRRR